MKVIKYFPILKNEMNGTLLINLNFWDEWSWQNGKSMFIVESYDPTIQFYRFDSTGVNDSK